MSEFAHIPDQLSDKTVRSLLPDDIYYPLQEIIMRNPDTMEAIIYGSSELGQSDKKPKKLLGRVGLMRAYGITPSGVIIDGFVADLRHVKGALETSEFTREKPDDIEEEGYWFQEQADRIRIIALAYRQGKTEEFSGNEDARSYIEHLTRTTDLLHAKNKKRHKTLIGMTEDQDREQIKTVRERIFSHLPKWGK